MPGIDINSIKPNEKSKLGKSKVALFNGIHFLNKEISIGKKSLNNKKRLGFYTDLHALLSSGIDIKTAFDLILDNYSKKENKNIIRVIQQEIIAGSSFSEAINSSGQFSLYEYYSIKIGEETGRLLEVLGDLSNYFTKKIEQQRKIINAFSYPIIVLLTAIAAIAFMMNFIVPMFEDVFKRYDRELPALTKHVIKAADGFTGYMLIITLIVISWILLSQTVKKKLWYRRIVSGLLMKMPVFGKLINKIYLSRFCLSMELLMSSRTPLLSSIQLIKKMITFYPIQFALDEVENDILLGKQLHQSLGKFKIFDKRMISLIKVAEEVNQLDKVFSRLKDQYSTEIEYQTGIISTVMEPLMIIFIGSFVGLILISMYLPMFQLSTGMGF